MTGQHSLEQAENAINTTTITRMDNSWYAVVQPHWRKCPLFTLNNHGGNS